MLGADVGSRVVVYASAVVIKPVPDDVEVAGNPARVVRDRRPGGLRPQRPAPRSGTQIADRHRKLVQHNVSKPTVSLIADRGLRVAGHIECCNGVKAGIVAAVPSQQHGRIVHQVRTIRFVLLPIDRSP